MNNEQRKRTERLCAYLFDELTQEERLEVEGRLAAEAAWQEELERLSRTADWVRDGMADEETLSEESMQALLDEATQAQIVPGAGTTWTVRSALSAAAASLAMIAAPAWLLWGQAGESSGSVAKTDVVAVLEVLREEGSQVPAETPDPLNLPSLGGKLMTATTATEAGKPSSEPVSVGPQPRSLQEMLTDPRSEQKGGSGGTVWFTDAIPFETFHYLRLGAEVTEGEVMSTDSALGGAWPTPGSTPQPDPQMGYTTLQDGPSLGRKSTDLTKKEDSLAGLGYVDGSNVSALGLRGMPTRGLENDSMVVVRPSVSPQESGSVRRDYREQWLRTYSDLDGLNVPQAEALPVESERRKRARKGKGVKGSESRQLNFDLPRQLIVPRPVDRFQGSQLALEKDRAGDREVAAGSDAFFLGQGAAPAKKRTDESITHILDGCRALPGERPRDMFFRFYGDNPFQRTDLDPLSTFAADVDTASYRLALRMLEEGILPEKAQIRTEEFVNAIEPDLPAPTESTFGVSMELAPSPYGGREDRWLLRVGVRAREVDLSQRSPLALTFVVDVSGSMKEERRLELVKHALRMLSLQLDSRDTIALVAFSQEARVVLAPTPATQREALETAIHSLQPDGGTNAEAGLVLGYELAGANWIEGSHNRVVFLSDGVANIGETDQNRINEDVSQFREQGIYLNTIGVGLANHNDVFLEQLADHGDGICDYVGNAEDVQRAMVERFTGAFVPVAEDVKIQVEFDPSQVLRYRQLGYENRAVADADFRNDAVDAGEVGAGHQVVCLYEIERRSGTATEQALATARVRWQAPRSRILGAEPASEATEIESRFFAPQASGSFAAASLGFQRSAQVAQLAEVLRNSVHALGDSFEALRVSSRALGATEPSWGEFCEALDRTANLLPTPAAPSPVDSLREELRGLELRWQSHSLGDEPLDEGAQASHRQRLEEVRQALREALQKEFEASQR